MTEDTVQSQTATWRDYYDLCKPKVVMLLLLTAIVGVVLASPPGDISIFVLVMSSLGIGLAASAGAAINQIVERENDAKQHGPTIRSGLWLQSRPHDWAGNRSASVRSLRLV